MFSFAVKHLSDTPGTGFAASRAMGDPGLSGAGMKPVLRKYGIRTSYTVDEANGNDPYEVAAVFPSGTYSALDYTPVREGYRFLGWGERNTDLPYDAELEWIGTNGGALVVDTGYTPNQDTGYQIKYRYTEGSRSGRVGVDQTISGKRYSMIMINGGGWISPASYSQWNPTSGTYNKYGEYGSQAWTWEYGLDPIGKKYYGWKYNSSEVRGSRFEEAFTLSDGYPSTWQWTNTIKAFGLNSIYLSSNFRLYYLILFQDGDIVRHFVPVRSNGAGYLYDKINGVLCSKTGAGSFILGPDAGRISTSKNVPYSSPTIYAVWQAPTTITFDATTNGGTMPSGWVSPYYYCDQPYGTLPQPTKSGSVFVGWFSGTLHQATSSKVPAASTTLVAKYAVPTYDTSFEVTTTSSYRKAGIYVANSRNTANPTIVDWGDGSTSVVYGNISQLVHTYSSNGTFTVRVNNNISSFALSGNDSTWYGTTTNNRYVVKKVTAIGSNVTSIPTYAFNYCSAMTDAVLPTTISSVPNYCFYYCSDLKGITIPSNYTSIGSYAFFRCGSSSFTSVTIPAAVTTINSYAFQYCNYLHPVFEASTSTLTLGNYAFSQCGSQRGSSFTIDMSMRKVTSIPNYCFQYCRYLNGFVWPQNVTSVGQYAFQYCFNYSSSTGTMAVPEGVTTIGNYSFANCLYLTDITLPSTLSNMNNNSLRGNTRMTTITVNRSTAPTAGNSTFGGGTNDYTGRNSYSAGTNKLYVPAGATGYTSSYWGSVLLDSTKCGFTLEEMQ